MHVPAPLLSIQGDPGSDLCHPDSGFPGLPQSLQKNYKFGQDWLVGSISNFVFAAQLCMLYARNVRNWKLFSTSQEGYKLENVRMTQ
jgi:hypothetical protein